MEILESDAQIAAQIIDEINKILGISIKNSFGGILNKTRELVTTAIKQSPEYDSILNGELRQHFGLISPQTVLDNILDAILRDIDIKYDGKQLNIEIMKGDYSSALNASGASYDSNGYDINWLEWLLTRGDEVIIEGYAIQFSGTRIKTSRAGYAIMKEGYGSWGVPEFTGTPDDNWFTRALQGIDTYIEVIVQEELNARL